MSKADGTTYNPGPVPKEVLDFFRAKGYKIGFDWRDVWAQEHATAFTVAKAMEVDLLADIREAVEAALEQGQTFAQFKKQLKPILAKKGWWGRKEMTDPETGEVRTVQLGSPRRLKTIYRANMRTARAAGQWDRVQRTKQLRPYLRYSLGPSRVHRDQHVAWDGLILPVDHVFWKTHYPPNGWGCKCRVRQISQREAERSGGISADPEVKTVKWENKRTGAVLDVPAGIDPGWDTNPGLEGRTQIAARHLREKIAAAPDDIRMGAKKFLSDA